MMLDKKDYLEQMDNLFQLYRNRHLERITKGDYSEETQWRILLSYYIGRFGHGIDSQDEFIEALHNELLDIEKRFEGTGFPAWLSIGPGWYRIVADVNSWLRLVSPEYQVVQVKSKYAGLRYYVDYNTDEDSNFDVLSRPLISYGETLSYRACEECGDTGTLRANGWYRTLCDECEQRRLENHQKPLNS